MARPGFETHFVTFSATNKGRKSIAVCGDWCDERDIATDPTCEHCQAELAKYATETVESVFGEPTVGTQVKSHYGDPLAGYQPRQRRHGFR